MCKIFALTNALNVPVTERFIGAVRDAVCAHSDKDGFGYAIGQVSGKVCGEKTVTPFEFNPLEPNLTSRLSIIEPSRSKFGYADKSGAKSFIGHGRFSTNRVSLANTHPFVEGNRALIHNGVVQDTGPALKLKTDCDSEILLRRWIDGGMRDIEKHVTGYYAMAVIDNGFLHIVKDSVAQLCVAWSETIQSYVIATTAEIIIDVAAEMKWLIESPERIGNDLHAVFDGNKLISKRDIAPLGIKRGAVDMRVIGMVDALDTDTTEYPGDSDLNEDDGPYSEYATYVERSSR